MRFWKRGSTTTCGRVVCPIAMRAADGCGDAPGLEIESECEPLEDGFWRDAKDERRSSAPGGDGLVFSFTGSKAVRDDTCIDDIEAAGEPPQSPTPEARERSAALDAGGGVDVAVELELEDSIISGDSTTSEDSENLDCISWKESKYELLDIGMHDIGMHEEEISDE
eukprot:Amastigsp_a29_1461.p2 type:complete len:167 gc:universal Amastigsp_a29_1461:507-1007(+)